MEYGKPSTPEEIAACETSSSGVICVVKDLGSKFGTFVSVDEGLVREQWEKRSANDDDGNANNAAAAAAGGGDETGDETDDEVGGIGKGDGMNFNYVELKEGQVRAARLLSDNDNDNATPYKFTRLEQNTSFPLLQLSHSKSPSSSSSSAHVIILFGPQGSAIRLSLLPLQFTFSRIKKAELDPILASLHYIGASHSDQWDVIKSTHLVAPDKTAAAKGIMAWACRKPVVTSGYIEALLGRTKPGDALPKEEEYTPPGNWDAKLVWTDEPSNALKGYRIGVMVDDDNAPLTRSAGGDVLSIHEEAPSASRADFEAWWGTQMHKALDEKVALVVVPSTSKKCKNYNDWLKHIDGVRFTNSKNIAKAITNKEGAGDLILDTKKAAIEKIEGWDAVVVEDAKKPAASSVVGAETAKTAEEKTDEAPPPGDDDGKEPAEEEEMPVSTRRKRRHEDDEETGDKKAAEQPREEQPPDDRQKRRRKDTEKEAPVEKPAEEEAPAEEDAQPPVGEAAAVDKSTAKKSNSNKGRIQTKDDSSDEDEPGVPEERASLPTAEDGWLVAAPKKRRAFRREIDDDYREKMKESELDNLDSAATEKVSGLIVRKYVPQNQRGGRRSVGRAGANATGKKKKDFKRCECELPSLHVGDSVLISCSLLIYVLLQSAKTTSCAGTPPSTPQAVSIPTVSSVPSPPSASSNACRRNRNASVSCKSSRLSSNTSRSSPMHCSTMWARRADVSVAVRGVCMRTLVRARRRRRGAGDVVRQI